MKLALLMTMLALNDVDAICLQVSAVVTFEGTLTCPHDFYAIVQIKEQDGAPFSDPTIAWQFLGLLPGGIPENYRIWGTTWENLQCETEPRLEIRHTCKGETQCLCKQFTGVESGSFNKRIDVDLMNNDLKECGKC